MTGHQDFRGRIAVTVAAVVIGLLAQPAVTIAGEPLTAGFSCGGDAFSSAEVVERRPLRRGPITATSETLCADLAPQQPPTRVDILAVPTLPEHGGRARRAPYDGWPLDNGPPRP